MFSTALNIELSVKNGRLNQHTRNKIFKVSRISILFTRELWNYFSRAPLETSHVPRFPICYDAGKALSPTHSKRQVFQTETLLVLSCVDLRTKGFQPSCAQNRLTQNQNCIRLGLGRFSEVPLRYFLQFLVERSLLFIRLLEPTDMSKQSMEDAGSSLSQCV